MVFISILGLSTLSEVNADELYLKDGSRVKGSIAKWANGQVNLEETFAGSLSFDSAQVVGIGTSTNMIVALETGDEIVGQLQFSKDEGQRLISPTFGTVSIETARIRGIWPEGRTEPKVAETKEQMGEELEATEKKYKEQISSLKKEHGAVTKKLEAQIDQRAEPWSATAEFGLNGQTGNSQRLGFRGRGEVRRETDFDRLSVYMQGEFARQDGVRSENEIMGGSKLEVDVTDRWYALGKIDLEFDEFENLDLRTRINAGMGYFVIDKEKEHLKVFGSPGYQHESFMDGRTVDQAIMELGWDYLKQFTPWLLFTQNTTFVPSLSDVNDFRVVADTAGEIPITGDKRWKFKIGMQNEYDNQPAPGVEDTDTTYYANLTVSFQ